MENKIELINKMIKELVFNYIKKENIDITKPFALNIQLNDKKTIIYEDIESLIVTESNVFITFYTPYNINKLRFDIDEKENKLMVRTDDFSFYKEFWFRVPIIKKSLSVSFNNNVLEIDLLINTDLLKVL